MKRIIAILLTVLLLGMLTACDQNVGRHADGIIKADKATFEIGKTHSSFEGMNIQIANAIWDDEEIKLDVNWINKTGYDVVYGSSYDIERENNGPVVLLLKTSLLLQLDMSLKPVQLKRKHIT